MTSLFANKPQIDTIDILRKLDLAEKNLRRSVRRYNSFALLHCIHTAAAQGPKVMSLFKEYGQHWTPFVGAGLAAFSIRWGNVHRGTNPTGKEFIFLYNRAQKYLLNDPTAFTPEPSDIIWDNAIDSMVRLVGSQFGSFPNSNGRFGRASLLWNDSIKRAYERKEVELMKFDFEQAIDLHFGASVKDFMKIAAWAFAFSSIENPYFCRKNIEDACRIKLLIHSEATLSQVLEKLTTTPQHFRIEYERWKQKDRLYRCHDFNPLRDYPIVRPDRDSASFSSERDILVTPIPAFVAERAASGVYYELLRVYDEPGKTENKFLSFFGYVFEEYVGILLRSAIGDNLLSESDLQRCGMKGQKVVDWCIIDGDTLIAVECKAVRLPHHTFGSGNPNSYYKQGLRQISKGLNQLTEFTRKLSTDPPDVFRNIKRIIPLIVTYERLYLFGDDRFRERVATYKQNKLDLDGWVVLAVDDIEIIEKHVGPNLRISTAIDMIQNYGVNKAQELFNEQCTRNNADSLVQRRQQDIFSEIGLH